MRQSKPSRIILASASPRRQQLLTGLGLDFEVISADTKEWIDPSLSPVTIAKSLACEKEQTVRQMINDPKALIIAGDTLVILGKKILGKPNSPREAMKMLSQLSGKTHTVITALCVTCNGKNVTGYETTKVTFRKLSSAIIKRYVDTREPMDKAGAYGIQGRAALLVKKIEGDYFNVMGLPLVKLSELLEKFGIILL